NCSLIVGKRSNGRRQWDRTDLLFGNHSDIARVEVVYVDLVGDRIHCRFATAPESSEYCIGNSVNDAFSAVILPHVNLVRYWIHEYAPSHARDIADNSVSGTVKDVQITAAHDVEPVIQRIDG